MIPLILAISLFLFTVIGFFAMVYHAIFYAPFVPTPYRVAKKMVKAANIQTGQMVYDLGAGDGRLAIMADKEGAMAKGFEISLFPYLISKINIFLNKSNARVVKKNFLHEKLGKANCIFCYLWPNLMQKLQKKFEEELMRGTKIISYCFPIKAWKPSKVIPTIKGNRKTFLIYVYEFEKGKKL